MRSSKLIPYRPVSALRRAFITGVPDRAQSIWKLQRVFLPTWFLNLQLQRSIYTKRGPPRTTNYVGNRPRVTAKLARLPRDHEITVPFVIIRSGDGELSAPQSTTKVLESLDLEKYSLRVEQLPDLGGKNEKAKPQKYARQGSDGGGHQYPICKVVDKKAEYEAERDKGAQEVRKKDAGSKEIELNWAIAPHDLQTRLRQLKAFLAKGMRVEVRLMSKAKQKKKKKHASREDAEAVLQAVKQAADEVKGTKEFKKTEGFVGAQLRLFYEGPPLPKETKPAELATTPTPVEPAAPLEVSPVGNPT